MSEGYSISAYWSDGMDEPGLAAWARRLRARLGAPEVTLGLVFLSPRFFPHAAQVLEVLRVHACIPLLAGCSGASLIAGGEEIESATGLVLTLFHLPGARLQAVRFTQDQVVAARDPGYWPLETGVTPDQVNGWLAFIDPFHLDAESWLRSWNANYPGQPVFGGLASGEFPEPLSQVYLQGEVFEDGGVAIAVGGDVSLAGIVAQGCTPIGETWTVTRVEHNLIRNIGNRPAYAVLDETLNNLSPDERRKTLHNLHIGLVMNEYQEDHRRGDFLVRNLIAGDPNTGFLAVTTLPRVGQTVQFQRRDAEAAAEEMDHLLEVEHAVLGDRPVYGACLFACNSRGRNFFGHPNHDAGLVQDFFGPLGTAGFFCNGEIGPVSGRNYLHGHTAALALFVKHQP